MYLVPLPAIVITNNQVNDILLALFGAFVPTALFSLVEYREDKRAAEEKFLDAMCEYLQLLANLGKADRPSPYNLVKSCFEELESEELGIPGVLPKTSARVEFERIFNMNVGDETSAVTFFSENVGGLRCCLHDCAESYVQFGNYKVDAVHAAASKLAYLGYGCGAGKIVKALCEHIDEIHRRTNDNIGLLRAYLKHDLSDSEALEAVHGLDEVLGIRDVIAGIQSCQFSNHCNDSAKLIHELMSKLASQSNWSGKSTFPKEQWWA